MAVREKLEKPETVVIIGGGPAGASCGIALKKLSRKLGREIDVIIYEPKILERARHFNQCIGVMSHPFIDILKTMEISFPEHLIQRRFGGYRLYCGDTQIDLKNPEKEFTFAVRRSEFDGYLLEAAGKEGVKRVHSRVMNLEFSRKRAAVFTDSDFRRCDCIVGAFGLDDAAGKMFEDATAEMKHPYRRPGYLNALITKLHPGKDEASRKAFLDEKLGHMIHAVLPPIKRIEFGAVTPKEDHLVVNIAGRRVRIEDMVEFAKLPQVAGLIPREDEVPEKPWFFKGKFPLGLASGFFGDRFVMVGDAAGIMRPFKGKGINTAILSGMKAAETICLRGFAAETFRRHYANAEDINAIVKDMPYGLSARRLAIYLSNNGKLDRVLELARREPALKNILYDAVSGGSPYRQTFLKHMRVGLFLKLAGRVIF